MPHTRADRVDESSHDASTSSVVGDVAHDQNATALTFYPAYCHKASPTWFTWVKLTAHDIHQHLHEQPRKFGDNRNAIILPRTSYVQPQGKLLYFLNHPIQFVQIVGVVVSIEEFLEWYWVFTVDDSSGATIEVHCKKPPRKTNETILQKGEENAADQNINAQDKEELKTLKQRAEIVAKLDIGHVVQVKGTIDMFRGTRKIQLERITLVLDTMAEMRLVAARTKVLKDILSNPWIVSASEQENLLKEARGELDENGARMRRRRKREALKEAREQRHAENIVREYEEDQVRRAEMAAKAQRAGLLLKGKSLSGTKR